MPTMLISVEAGASSVLDGAVTTAFENALAGIQGDVNTIIGIALPVALGIFAVCFVIRKGMKIFNSLAS